MSVNEKYNEYLRTINDLPYIEYLKTEHWNNFRKQCLEQFKECCLCGSGESLRVHHKIYNNKGKETFRDIVVLCDYCHAKTHLVAKEKNIDIEKMEIIFITLLYIKITYNLYINGFFKFEDTENYQKIITENEDNMFDCDDIDESYSQIVYPIVARDIANKKLKNASAYTIKNFDPDMYMNDLRKEGILYGICNKKLYTESLNLLVKDICLNINKEFHIKKEKYINNYENADENTQYDISYKNANSRFVFNLKDIFIKSIEIISEPHIKEIINKTLEYEDKDILLKKVVISLNDYYHKDIKSKQEKCLNELL